MQDRISEANQKIGNIEGWVGDRIYLMMEFVHRLHADNVHGDILEIGVHHGKLFFLMSAIRRDNERCIAVDLFDQQDLNIDRSGEGSFSRFESHLNNLFPQHIESVSPVSIDSMRLTPTTARRVLKTEGVRLLSIDGGHNVEHAVNDLCLAQELLVPSGVVMLDDFFGPHWPTVTEGFFKFMANFNTRLAPFLVFQNKLFLTTYSEHDQVLEHLRSYIEDRLGDEIHSGKWKYANISGFRTLCCS